ncbi:MAG TPA: CheY-P-specific phosphatase CheC [Lachnospiraceae bacterium]|nr:CheY-P-specific phosphatase CheC [Lachnospiraceae bacterium]
MQNQNTEILELDILKEIGNIGAGNATTALSQLINARIDMNIPKVAVLPFHELAEIIGGAETLVAGILLSLEGDVDGMMLFVLRTTAAHMLVNQLMGCGQPPSPETGGFNEIEESALKEIGNIITGSYLSSISSLTNMLIISSVPYLAVDMAGAILSVPAIEFGKMGDEALLIESQFKDMDVDISGYFILIPTMESYKRMLRSLGI